MIFISATVSFCATLSRLVLGQKKETARAFVSTNVTFASVLSSLPQTQKRVRHNDVVAVFITTECRKSH